MEVWKDIPGYEGYYQVSNLGRVKSLARMVSRKNQPDCPIEERCLKQRTGKNGYNYVVLSKEGKPKTALIHRMVATAFVKNPKGQKIVNHIDGDKQNNRFDNLEWCSSGENNKHAFETGLISKEKLAKSVMNPEHQNKNNTSGRKGVYFNKQVKKWQAYIKVNHKVIYLGVFEKKEDAIRAREEKEKELM